jgi:hypothetical protein
MSTFGAGFIDVDNDGLKDLVVVNGHPDDQIDFHRGNIRYLEKPQLFMNRGGGGSPTSAAKPVPRFSSPTRVAASPGETSTTTATSTCCS